jgi:hypothetical protein
VCECECEYESNTSTTEGEFESEGAGERKMVVRQQDWSFFKQGQSLALLTRI